MKELLNLSSKQKKLLGRISKSVEKRDDTVFYWDNDFEFLHHHGLVESMKYGDDNTWTVFPEITTYGQLHIEYIKQGILGDFLFWIDKRNARRALFISFIPIAGIIRAFWLKIWQFLTEIFLGGIFSFLINFVIGI